MDRTIEPAERRRRSARKLLAPAAVVVVVLALLFFVTELLRPSVRRDRIRVATVEAGEVAATLDASGLVAPRFEQVITAPLETRILTVLKRPGAEVSPGEAILELDPQEARREVARLEERIALQRNLRVRTELELARTRDDLTARHEIKTLELKSFEFEVGRSQELYDLGLIMYDDVRKARTDMERATIELRHLKTQLENAEQDLAARLAGQVLEISILEKDLDRAGERLDRTTVTGDRDAVVTWVATSEGATVTEGEPVARIADLGAYRVDATLSDVLARRLSVGLPATVRSGDARLPGRVDKILPTVENGIVTFEVALDRPDHPVLRPNLRVDVHAVTERHAETLRLKRGPLVTIEGREAVFVVHDDVAVRTWIEVGLSSFEHYEITSGLAEGDVVVVSDMSDYRNAEEVRLK